MNEDPKKVIYRRLIYDGELADGAFRFWHYLRDRKNMNDQTWPSQSVIAADLKCKESSITRWTTQLVEGGYLGIERIGQNHHIRYTILYGKGEFVSPQWAVPNQSRTTQTGATKTSSPLPNGNVAPTNGQGPRTPHWGGGSNLKEDKSRGNPAPYEKILAGQELKRVEDRMAEIRGSYDSHQDLSGKDKAELQSLKNRRGELKQILGFIV